MQTLAFQQTPLVAVPHNNQTWLTATDIASALGYAAQDAVSRIYRRNQDEFTPLMTETVKLTVSGNYQKEVRIFSLRGAHLIAMFARTPAAKDFRKWVLDVLDQETAHQSQQELHNVIRQLQQSLSNCQPQFDEKELCELSWLWQAAKMMNERVREIYPLLKVADHRLQGAFYSMGWELPRVINNAQKLLLRETANIKISEDPGYFRVLEFLRK